MARDSEHHKTFGPAASASPRRWRAPGCARGARRRPGSRPAASRSTAPRSPRRRSTSRAADRITVDGKPLPQRERTRLFLYHKPRGLVTTHADPQGRPTVFAALPKHLPRLLSVGRLDANTEGLLLLTNDGGLARVLELPATGWLRRYRVRAHGRVQPEQLDGTALRHHHRRRTLRRDRGQARPRSRGPMSGSPSPCARARTAKCKNVLGHLGLRGEPPDPGVVRPVPAWRARGRRGRGGTHAASCASSSASGSWQRPARISPGRSVEREASTTTKFRRRQPEAPCKQRAATCKGWPIEAAAADAMLRRSVARATPNASAGRNWRAARSDRGRRPSPGKKR